MKITFFSLVLFLFSLFLFVPYSFAKCSDTRPTSAPVLLSAVPLNDTSVQLVWQEAQDPVSYYLLAYGTSEISFEYGVPDIGGKGTTTFTVDNLQKGVKYYFKVRAGNGCKPGEFSNKLSATPGKTEDDGYIPLPPKLTFGESILGATNSVELRKTKASYDSDIETLADDSDLVAGICIRCRAELFLLTEIIIIFLYFFLIQLFKPAFLKPIYVVFIPLLIFFLFHLANKGCISEEFLCKYFTYLNLFIFFFSIIIYRQLRIRSHEKR